MDATQVTGMNAVAAAAPSPPSVPMLPADQVAAIIEQMKAEQARLLHDQQEAIVQQVIKSLRESGVASVHDQTAEKNHPRTGKRRPKQSPSKLEQNLHALVLHSLEQSGLDYPHVQRNVYAAAAAAEPPQQHHQDLRSTRPPTKSVVHAHKKLIIVSRHESANASDDEGNQGSGSSVQQGGLECSGESTSQQARPSSASMNKLTVLRADKLRASPLRCTPSTRQTTRRNKTTAKTRRRHRRDDEDDENNDEVTSEFNAVRNKVGQKTLAILDRSRALLEQIKTLPSAQRQREANTAGGDKTFVNRMRQRLVEADAISELQPALTTSKPGERDQDEGDMKDLEEDLEPNLSEPCLPAKDIENSAHTETGPPSPPLAMQNACEEIEILRPPEHSPENDNEWENELARQILTIYATSVKAKASNKSPSRSGSRASAAVPSGNSPAPRLGTSCSLPAISGARLTPFGAAPTTTKPPISPPRAVVHYSWEPSQRLHGGKVIINMPKVPKPIWFAGTGAVKAVWCAIAEAFHGVQTSPSKTKPRAGAALAMCDHQLCDEIRRFEAKQQYSQCITTLEALLINLVRARGVDTLERKLWKQLVVTCNAFASRCVDYKKFPIALLLIKQAEQLIHNSILVDASMRLELLAYLYDTYAHYYYKRAKSHAGLQYMLKAHDIHTRQSSWAHLAKCQLHIANLLSSQGKHDQAITYLAQILEMIEENKLEQQGGDEGSASAQKICLAAVCYNNLAIEQLHLRQFEQASVSTGNAKRLAKLCLSYSNRWLAQFDATSNCVDLAIATLMEDENGAANAPYKLQQ